MKLLQNDHYMLMYKIIVLAVTQVILATLGRI